MTKRQHLSTRRTVLRALSAGLVLPVVPTVLRQSPVLFTGDLSDVERIALQLVQYRDRSHNPFAAEASVWLGVARILGFSAAAAILLQYLGVRPAFARDVNYERAGSCRPNFENLQHDMRAAHLTSYSGVHRSPLDQRIAVLAAKPPDRGASAQQGQIGTQVDGAGLMTLEGEEAGIIAMASDLVRSRHGLTGADLARTVPLTNRQDVWQLDGNQRVPVRVFSNHAGGRVLWDRRPFGRANAGTIAVHVPDRTDPRNLPMLGLST